MPRAVTFDVPTDPTQFDPLQIRPRVLLGFSVSALARWFAAHVASYPALLSEHRTAFAFTVVQLDYALPHLRFTDADWLAVTGRLMVADSAKYVRLTVDFHARGGATDPRPVASFQTDLRVVTIVEDHGLTALPGLFPENLLAKFLPDEVYRPDRAAIAATATPPTGEQILGEVSRDSTLCRSQCEVADQWSFIEVIEALTAARERLFLLDTAAPTLAKLAVRLPLRGVTAVFHRAMFVFDTVRIRTRAIAGPNGSDNLVFLHTVHDPSHEVDCVTAWETLTEPAPEPTKSSVSAMA
jgi:hypothetical protein